MGRNREKLHETVAVLASSAEACKPRFRTSPISTCSMPI